MTDAATRPAAAPPRAPSPARRRSGVALGLITAMLLRIRTTPDVDLYLHLRIGDLLNAGQRFGTGPDPLATLADQPYVPTQWLAQRAMAWTWAAAGMDGIQVVRLLLVICLGAAVVATCRLVASTAAAGFAAALTMFGAAAAWGERPQLAGLVLFAVVTLLWWRSTLRGAVPWAVVPLTWLWACLHGTWTLGIGAGVVLLAGAIADARLTRRDAVRGVAGRPRVRPRCRGHPARPTAAPGAVQGGAPGHPSTSTSGPAPRWTTRSSGPSSWPPCWQRSASSARRITAGPGWRASSRGWAGPVDGPHDGLRSGPHGARRRPCAHDASAARDAHPRSRPRVGRLGHRPRHRPGASAGGMSHERPSVPR